MLGVAPEGTRKETDKTNFTPRSGNCICCHSLFCGRGEDSWPHERFLRSAVAHIPASRYFRGTFLSSRQTDLILHFDWPLLSSFAVAQTHLRLSFGFGKGTGPPFLHPPTVLPCILTLYSQDRAPNNPSDAYFLTQYCSSAVSERAHTLGYFWMNALEQSLDWHYGWVCMCLRVDQALVCLISRYGLIEGRKMKLECGLLPLGPQRALSLCPQLFFCAPL